MVVDEPLYAHYLAVTRKSHPGMEEVIAAGETDWRKVVADLSGAGIPACHEATADKKSRATPRIFYQKHMTHHLLPEMGREWIGRLTNCFLIRDPKEVLASYVKIVETPTLEDTGFPQQAEIFEFVRRQSGRVPAVIDAADVLRDPRRMLGLLCEAVGVDFQEAMLSWPQGPRASDGVWAKYWYAEVEKSTGFRPYEPKQVELTPRLEQLRVRCAEYYDRLYEQRLK